MTHALEQTRETLPQALERLSLSIKAEFVPFSQSRNKGEKLPSLNWRVTLVVGADKPDNPMRPVNKGREILTTDYMAGSGHCPSYKAGIKDRYMRDKCIAHECETGKAAKYMANWDFMASSGKPILPNAADVVHSLIMDAGVLDHPDFESWASDYGYETDSRKAEAIYRACLEIALKLRNGLGESVLSELRDAAQDY